MKTRRYEVSTFRFLHRMNDVNLKRRTEALTCDSPGNHFRRCPRPALLHHHLHIEVLRRQLIDSAIGLQIRERVIERIFQCMVVLGHAKTHTRAEQFFIGYCRSREREARAAAEAEVAALRAQLEAEQASQAEALSVAQAQLSTLNQERDAVRQRVEKMLHQMDELL